jgi:gamma-glutamyltranspeptidase/glutathione hydrolase
MANHDRTERRFMRLSLTHLRAGVALGLGLLTAACSGLGDLPKLGNLFAANPGPQPGQVGSVRGFLGGVVADEPLAALAGRDVLSSGANAMDAAAAVMTTLWVTYPSRAGLGGGGACLVYFASRRGPGGGAPEAVLFPPQPSGLGGERPIAVPMAARGLFLMHARYGSRPLETHLAAAEQMARFGVNVSRALLSDLRVVGGALLADPGARGMFAPNGMPLGEGDTLRLPELAATLSALRVSGVGDLYQGALARRIEATSPRIGGPLGLDRLRSALPQLTAPLRVPVGLDVAAFPPPPVDGGLAAAAAFKGLLTAPNDVAGADARAQASAATWRAGGVNAQAVLDGQISGGIGLPSLPASTGFVVLDKDGNAVSCALTMNNLFGTGRVIPDVGILAAASPDAVPPPLLAAAIVWNENLNAFRAAVAGSGQAGAATAVAVALSNTLRAQQPMPAAVPEPGRANVIACGRYLPSESASCGQARDPRSLGLAVGGT